MKRIWIGAVLACLLLSAAPAQAAAPKPRSVETLSMSNFRYCKAKSCDATDVGYLRTSSGPVRGSDNPLEVVKVKQYSVVLWFYRDSQCDGSVLCPGHNIYFENGTPGGQRIGQVKARKKGGVIVGVITQKPGTTIRYFCSVNGHYTFGMTGLLKVVK